MIQMPLLIADFVQCIVFEQNEDPLDTSAAPTGFVVHEALPGTVMNNFAGLLRSDAPNTFLDGIVVNWWFSIGQRGPFVWNGVSNKLVGPFHHLVSRIELEVHQVFDSGGMSLRKVDLSGMICIIIFLISLDGI